MAMAYAAVWFCFLSIFFNLISLGIAAIRVRPGLMPLPLPRAAPGVSVVRPFAVSIISAKRPCNRVLSSIIRPMRLFFASRGRPIPPSV